MQWQWGREAVLQNLFSEKHKNFKNEIVAFAKVKSVDHLGTILSIEIESDFESGYFNQLRDFLYKSFLEKDVLICPLGNIIYILPPFIITESELDHIYSVVKQVLREI